MARILMSAENAGTSFIVKRVLMHKGGHEVDTLYSDAEVVSAVQRTSFHLAILEGNHTNRLSLALAEALMLHDPSLPLLLIAYHIPREAKAAVAQIPFKVIFGMPLPVQGLLNLVSQYAHAGEER